MLFSLELIQIFLFLFETLIRFGKLGLEFVLKVIFRIWSFRGVRVTTLFIISFYENWVSIYLRTLVLSEKRIVSDLVLTIYSNWLSIVLVFLNFSVKALILFVKVFIIFPKHSLNVWDKMLIVFTEFFSLKCFSI